MHLVTFFLQTAQYITLGERSRELNPACEQTDLRACHAQLGVKG